VSAILWYHIYESVFGCDSALHTQHFCVTPGPKLEPIAAAAAGSIRLHALSVVSQHLRNQICRSNYY